MKIKNIISISAGILISLFFIYLGFKNVPVSKLFDYIKGINFFYIIPSVLLVLFSFIIRALRWRVLLSNKLKITPIFNIMMTGFMLNCIMPGRVGEITRPILIKNNSDVGFPEAISTVAVERAFDLAILLIIFASLYPIIDIPDSLSYKFGSHVLSKELLLFFVSGMTKIGLILGVGLLFVAYERTRSIIFKCIDFFEFLIKKLPSKYYNFLNKYFINLIKNFVSGLASGTNALKSPLNLIIILFYSSIIWLSQALSYYLLSYRAFGIKLGFPEITFVLVIVSFFIAIPSVPGFWGVWEAGGIFAMSVFGVLKTQSAGFNLVNHAIQMFPVIITGLISAWFIGFSIKSIKEK